MDLNLRALARQYARGLTDKEEYRRARADLIESALHEDPTEPSATDPQAELQTTDPQGGSSAGAADSGAGDGEGAAMPVSPAARRMLLATGAVLGAGLVVLVWLALG
jgi:hypothetical protein